MRQRAPVPLETRTVQPCSTVLLWVRGEPLPNLCVSATVSRDLLVTCTGERAPAVTAHWQSCTQLEAPVSFLNLHAWCPVPAYQDDFGGSTSNVLIPGPTISVSSGLPLRDPIRYPYFMPRTTPLAISPSESGTLLSYGTYRDMGMGVVREGNCECSMVV
jgi:hypothetical protein